MRKSGTLVAATAAALFLGISVAFATSGAHFFSATSSVANNGALVVSWDEAGVGQQQVNYRLTADGTATYACINGGGNHPKASNKENVSGPLSSPITGFQPENGRVQGSLSVGPLGAGSFSCPSGQTFVLACVSYSNLVLRDLTNNVIANPAPVQKTFVNTAGCP